MGFCFSRATAIASWREETGDWEFGEDDTEIRDCPIHIGNLGGGWKPKHVPRQKASRAEAGGEQ